MTFIPLSFLNSPSFRISYFDYILGEFFPITHVICVIELDSHTVWWHEWSHRMLTYFCPVHDSALELYFAKLAGNNSTVNARTCAIEQYREFMEGHASAMVKLADKFRSEEETLKKILEKKTGLIVGESEFGQQIAMDLERISRQINSENPIDACQSVSNALGGCCTKDSPDAPAYKEALSWLKSNWHMFRGLSSIQLTQKLARELDKEGFTALGPFYGFSTLHIRIMTAILHYLNFIRLALAHNDITHLVPILIPLLNSVLADWGPSIMIVISGERAREPRSAYRFPIHEYKPPQIKRHCLVSNQFADLVAKCLSLKEGNLSVTEKLKTHFRYFWETLAQVENLWLSTPDCEECSMLQEEIRAQQSKLRIDLKEKPISKSKTIFLDAIELYEPWLEKYAVETARDLHYFSFL